MPTPEQIRQKLEALVRDKVGLYDGFVIGPDTSFVDDMGCDSLDLVEIIMATEAYFSISIPDEDVENIKTFGEYEEYLQNRKDLFGN